MSKTPRIYIKRPIQLLSADFERRLEPVSKYEKIGPFTLESFKLGEHFSVVAFRLEGAEKPIQTVINRPQSDYLVHMLNNLGRSEQIIKSPYHHFIALVKDLGGRIVDLTVTCTRNDMYYGVICAEIGNQIIAEEIPIGDLMVYSTLMLRPFYMLKEIYEQITDDPSPSQTKEDDA